MPIAPPVISNWRYQQLVDETLARVPVHTPEWTNFSHSDPGVTLVQLFSFLTENLLYRANQIPERNHIKFLQLLGVPLLPASAAEGLVTINNERGALETQLLTADLEVRAGSIPFRTERRLAVLPVEARVFFKRLMVPPPANLVEYYTLLYASYQSEIPADPQLYETVAFDRNVVDQVDLGADTVDRSLWIALLGRKGDEVRDARDPWKNVRDKLGGQPVTIGLVPALDAAEGRLAPGGESRTADLLSFEMPLLGEGRMIVRDGRGQPMPRYRQLEPRTEIDVLKRPGIVELVLPAADEIGVWNGLDPLEAGVGDLPPSLDDSALAARLITWIRVRALGAAQARLLWAGINTVHVRQRERVSRELLPDGDGTPDQVRRLSRAPVLKGSIQVFTEENGETHVWNEIDDLMAAGPEVPANDLRLTPGSLPPPPAPTDVFLADAEAGKLTFGDGLRGRRLPVGRVTASYEYCQGAAGNVDALAIDTGPLLPSGFVVSNAVRSWGGADAERVQDGEKQIKKFLQHRDRLVSAEDFQSIAWRAPGIQIGRVDVLPAFHPDLDPNEPGSAPGVVTIMAIPRHDAEQPDAPRADRLLLNALCRHLDPRRLVTTELIVRGPIYKPLWISVGIDVAAGLATAEVVDAVKKNLRRFLAPLPDEGDGSGYATQSAPLFAAADPSSGRGWPLRAPVSARVLLAVTARVPGVTSVIDVLLAQGSRAPAEVVEMTGLELPRILGISVVAGEPRSIAALRGDDDAEPPPETPSRSLLPVPIIPETC